MVIALRTIDISIISLAAIAIVDLVLQFDSVIINATIGAIVTVLVGNRYLESRPGQLLKDGSPI